MHRPPKETLNLIVIDTRQNRFYNPWQIITGR